MIFSVATANFFFLPFEQTVDIIAQAGFEYIELDLYFQGDKWAMAQHLKDLSAAEAVSLVHRAGLKVSSIHDGGGVVRANHDHGFINPQLLACLEQLGYAPGCIVFHPPQIQGNYDRHWWDVYSKEAARMLNEYRSYCPCLTIENLPPLEGYYIPLLSPAELAAFTADNGLGVTIDTTHYAQMGIDIIQVARQLAGQVKTIHLSDYLNDQTHVFVGDGELNLAGFFQALKLPDLHSLTLECSVSYPGQPVDQVAPIEMISRLKIARERLANWLPLAMPG